MRFPKIKRFAQDEAGSATVEVALWFPLYLGLMASIVDLSMGIYQMNHAWDVARDLTRKVSVGEMTYDQAQQQATTQFGQTGLDVAVTRTQSHDVQFRLTMTPQLILWDAFDIGGFNTINVQYTMREEVAPAEDGIAVGGV